MLHIIRILLVGTNILLTLVLIFLVIRLSLTLRRLNEAELSTRMFLRALEIRSFIVWLTIAIIVFIVMPLSLFGYLFTDTILLAFLHDTSHLVFLVIIMVGLLKLNRLVRFPFKASA